MTRAATWREALAIACALACGAAFSAPKDKDAPLCAEPQECMRLAADALQEGREEDALQAARLGCGMDVGAACSIAAGLASEEEALPLMERGCALGFTESCAALGVTLAAGTGQGAARGRSLLQDACGQDNALACSALAALLLESGNWTAAAPVARKACGMGDADACLAFARMNKTGQGVARNEARASEYFRKACLAGNGQGCFALGLQRWNGLGGPSSESGALDAFERACDRGLAEGCQNAGVFHERGYGARKSDAYALPYYARGCELGSETACRAAKVVRERAKRSKR